MENKYVLENVCYTVTDPKSGEKREILHDISLLIPDRQVLTITGPSGSGKSSLLFLLNLMRDATGGRILLDGHDIRSLNVLELRRKVGMVFQRPYMFKGSVEYNVLLGPNLRGARPDRTTDELLQMVGLDPHMLQQEATSLSGGEQQRVTLARTLANEPEILLLDEVTASLDHASALYIESLIARLNREHGMTIIWVTHDLGQARRAGHRRLEMVEGRIVGEEVLR